MTSGIRRRTLLLSACAAIVMGPHTVVGAERAVDLAHWRRVRIGAGGFIVGIDLSSEGAILARTDTYGAWICEPKAMQWRQLVTIDSMPMSDRHEDSAACSWPLDAVFAPSEPGRIYMALGGAIYRSDDYGRAWRQTNAEFASGMGENGDDAKVNGRKLAVDPRNADVMLASRPSGPIRLTVDGGNTWNDVTDVPIAEPHGKQAMGHLILFDPNSPAMGGRTSLVYASAWGRGVFRSDDLCATWTQLAGGPSRLRHAAVTKLGVVFVVGEESNGQTRIWRFNEVWSDITPETSSSKLRWHSVCASPHDHQRILLGREDGAICESLTEGKEWGPVIEGALIRREARDVPWLAWTDEDWMSNGDIRFDLTMRDTLIFAQGIGVWTAIFPPRSQSVTWRSHNLNIEQLVSNQCVHPPGSNALPLFACWDRGIWRLADLDSYPERHLPDRKFAHCWGIDYAGSDPGFLAATMSSQQATDMERSCFSSDGGRSWRPFESYPVWRNGKAGKGFIAASTSHNMVWVPAEGRGMPHFTLDGGEHWEECQLPGLTAEDALGFGAADFLRRYPLCADRVQRHQFYLVHYPKGVYSSSDGGLSWQTVNELKQWNSKYHSKLRAAPDKPGHLFHTGGHSNANRDGRFIHSADGGITWIEVPHIREVLDFAFGKAAPGRDNPTLYIAGYLHGQWGIYRSVDGSRSWTMIGDGFPAGTLDRIAALEGDKHEFGKVYVGLRGSGWLYGKR